MKTQIDASDIEGKTVSGVSYDDDDFMIAFTDGTFIYVTAEGDEDYASLNDNIVTIDSLPKHAAIDLGVITEAEYTDMIKTRQKEALEAREESDRAEFERLKKRFEGNS